MFVFEDIISKYIALQNIFLFILLNSPIFRNNNTDNCIIYFSLLSLLYSCTDDFGQKFMRKMQDCRKDFLIFYTYLICINQLFCIFAYFVYLHIQQLFLIEILNKLD